MQRLVGERRRKAEFTQPIVDGLAGQSRQCRSALVPAPAAGAQVVVGTEQLEQALGGAFVDVEERTQRRIEPFDGAGGAMAL